MDEETPKKIPFRERPISPSTPNENPITTPIHPMIALGEVF